MNLLLSKTSLKAFCLASMAFLFIQCSNDNSARDTAVEAAKKEASNKRAIAPAATRPPVIGSLPLAISSTEAGKGEEACVSITASQFNKIESMQYTMTWDPKVLKYKKVQGFGLPGMNSQNFGARAADKGIMAYSWYDTEVKGVTKPDETQLYQVCFQVVGDQGNETSVEFADSPVVIEISNSDSKFLDIAGTNGKVTVK